MRERMARYLKDFVIGESIYIDNHTTQILTLITEEIEKVENPNVGTGEDEELISIVARQAFEQCRYKILALLKK